VTQLPSVITPSLLLDLDRVRRNASRMRDIALRNGVRLRPHIKTHKCVEIARLQTQGFDGAITVSTLAEARAFAAEGFSDITYAVPIEPGKFDACIDILRSGIKLNLLTDDADTVHALSEAGGKAGLQIDVFLEVDCGYHRCGIEPDSEEAVTIPRQISDAANLRFAGILTHAGHSYNETTAAGVKAVANHERDSMVTLAERLRGMGIGVPTVSIGSTPSITHVDHLDGIDEIRPGNYILFDGYQATLGSCSLDDCALSVLAAVVHREPTRRRLVIDAGAIALSKDRGPSHIDPQCGYGRVLDLDGSDTGLRVDTLSQEHGEIHAPTDELFNRFRVGDRVRILANHSCLTAAQHSAYHVLEGYEVVDQWKIHTGW
jgi:D-serine deaminase-like pyridoxal phosphate-dependent protein